MGEKERSREERKGVSRCQGVVWRSLSVYALEINEPVRMVSNQIGRLFD